MPYVQRRDTKIVGLYMNPQPGYAEEFLEDNDEEVIAFRNPPMPTDEERIDEAFPQTDSARVIFEALFELVNRVIDLEGGNAITRAQMKARLKAKLS